MPNLQNFKGSSFCRSLGRSLGPKLRPNQDSVDLCLLPSPHEPGSHCIVRVAYPRRLAMGDKSGIERMSKGGTRTYAGNGEAGSRRRQSRGRDGAESVFCLVLDRAASCCVSVSGKRGNHAAPPRRAHAQPKPMCAVASCPSC